MTSPLLIDETVNSYSSSVGASETSAAHPVAQGARSIKQLTTRWPTAFVAAPATTVTLTFTLSRTDAPFHTIYDALGRRIQRTTTSGADERYVYDGQNVVQDLDSSSSVVTSYLNGPGFDNHLRQTNATAGISYFLTDHLGSTIGLTDSNANVVEQIDYDSFGNSTGSNYTRYTYTGREFDSDTGRYYYRARFYDPHVGRFISEDPIGFQGGVNWYAYVNNNPLRWIDPAGLDEDDLNPQNPAVNTPRDSLGVDSPGMVDLRCRHLRELLNREAKYGTDGAALMSSTLLGEYALTGLSNGPGAMIVDGKPIDQDWLITLKAVVHNQGLKEAMVVYAIGKSANWIGNKYPGGKTVSTPFTEMGERNAIALAGSLVPFSRIFDQRFMSKVCPCY